MPVIAAQTDLETDRLGKMSDDLFLCLNRQETTNIQEVSREKQQRQPHRYQDKTND